MREHIIACLLVTHLPVKAERQRYPSLHGKPVVIVERKRPGRAVLESSPEARGVAAGMPLGKALIRCPEAVALEADQGYYDDALHRIADALAMRFPVVEKGELGCLYARLEGMEAVYGGEERLIASLLQVAPPAFEPRVGVASGKFPAYVSAVTSRPGRAVKAPPDTAAFLSSHSIELLPVSRESKGRLRQAGIHTMGRLAAMTVVEAQSRLGSEGRFAWELAQGLEPGPMPALSRAAA